MDIINAIILGIVEGLTEFLPISSSGHLIVAESLLGFKDNAATFTVVIQMGAILAVIWFYRNDLIKRVLGLSSRTIQKFWLNIIIASMPAGVLGLLFNKEIESVMFHPVPVAIALIVGGIILWVVESRPSNHKQTTELADVDAVTPMQAVWIGVAQIFALVFPGTSRSGATIVGGMLTGLNRATSTAFSFYLGMPILVLASLYKLYKARDTLSSSVPGGSLALIVGTVVSFVSALVVVSWLLNYVSRNNFKPFAVYRVVLGVIILVLVATGVMSNA
jgi:undecaprenyl-diphosphatase